VNAIELAGVTLSIGGRTILSDVDAAIGPDEFIGVFGPNGAGKTTLLRAILGLIRPSAGEIRVLGQRPAHGNPLAGYIPQVHSSGAELGLRGWDLVAGAVDGHRWGLPLLTAADRRMVEWALDTVGATTLAERPIAQLSGGERQRLMLAQALLGKPRLLLLDEPLISLDPHYQKLVIDLVRRVQKELGIAVLFTAHELNPLLGTLDRVFYLGNGRAALGSVDEVVTGPVLSRLYGSPIDVVRINGRVFVMSGEQDVERDHHRHDA
jgi:zinc/manganese transport system ATP-binding protein